MDPTGLTLDQWTQIGVALRFFWGALVAAIFAASNLILAHAIIPSAVSTGTIPAKYGGLRKVLYGAGFFGLVCWVALLGLAVSNLGWLSEFFPRYWQ